LVFFEAKQFRYLKVGSPLSVQMLPLQTHKSHRFNQH